MFMQIKHLLLLLSLTLALITEKELEREIKNKIKETNFVERTHENFIAPVKK